MSDSPSPGFPVDPTPLTGDRVRLRALRDDDLPTLVRWWSDEVTATQLVGGLRTPRPVQDLAEMFTTWSRNDTASCGFCVEVRETGQLIGHAALYGASLPHLCATFAILIGPAHQDAGYGTETTRLVVDFGFGELPLHRIELGVFAFNERAIATYRKVGFTIEGVRREAIYRSGRWHDHVSMAMLRGEWEAARATYRGGARPLEQTFE
jgi:RimJ/RimL family protein N-acetyltransferase